MASKLNAEYNKDLKAAYERIMAHPKVFGIGSKIGTPGRDLDMKIYKQDLENRGFHRFDGNVFMAAFKLHDGVLVSHKKAMEWKDKYYAEATGSLPADMPYAFNIALSPGESGPEDVSKRGKLQLASPPEAWDALVFRIDELVSHGADEEELDKWKQAALTAPMQIVTADASEWMRIAEREQFGHGFVLLYRTAFGRWFETVDIIAKEELASSRALTSIEVAAMWKEKVDQTEVVDQVTARYLDVVMKLKRKLFSDADAVVKLAWADDHFGPCSPWDSIYRIDLLTSKMSASPNDTEKRARVMDYVHDRCRRVGSKRARRPLQPCRGKGSPGATGSSTWRCGSSN